MQGTILSNRRGIRTQHNYQYLIKIDDDKYNSKEAVSKLTGKKVTYKTIGNNSINGKISSAHGNKGVVRVIFEKGLPGLAITEKVEIK